MKIIQPEEIAGLIKDAVTVAIGGFGSYGCPDFLLHCIAKNYREFHHPNSLTIVTGIGAGNNQRDEVGLNRLKEKGLIETVLAAHIANAPEINDLVARNEIAAFLYPLGVMAHLMRAIAGKKPGVITQVGRYTMADPELDGCCINEKARSQYRKVVENVIIGEKTYLFYPGFHIDVTMIRATYADEKGNLSFDHEALTGMELEMALAAHNNGGIVIAQVEQIVKADTIHPKKVRIHHSLIDYVVLSDQEMHHQGYATTKYRPELCGEVTGTEESVEELPLNIRKVIARRGVLELKPGMTINLGVGIPSYVGPVAKEESIGQITLSLESGPIGGFPVSGVGFAASVNPESIGTLTDTFDFYDGGGLDLTCLGAAEIDCHGNVNVSSFKGRCPGPGGFINISQNTPIVCFMCIFTAGKSDISVKNGRLEIKEDGSGIKFVNDVQQVTFSADYARENGQKVLYITERAVFSLDEHGICLEEIAPGVDLQKDILDKMEFTPAISEKLKLMDERLFLEMPMKESRV